MSREAFGDPPDPEPQGCPVCGGQEHVEGCELGREVARRIKAEKELNEWRELALSQAGDAGIVARMVKAETELALLVAALDSWDLPSAIKALTAARSQVAQKSRSERMRESGFTRRPALPRTDRDDFPDDYEV